MANGAVYSDAGGIEFIHDKSWMPWRYHRGGKRKSILVAYWYKHDPTGYVDRLETLGVKYGKLDSDQSIEIGMQEDWRWD